MVKILVLSFVLENVVVMLGRISSVERIGGRVLVLRYWSSFLPLFFIVMTSKERNGTTSFLLLLVVVVVVRCCCSEAIKDLSRDGMLLYGRHGFCC